MAEFFVSAAANTVGNLISDYVPPIINQLVGLDKPTVASPPRGGLEFLQPKYLKASKSSTVALDGIIKGLKNYGVNMVGLHGMPGVGKTTLAKQVGNYFEKRKLFDKVVIVTMSQTPTINKIQDRIAEFLGLKFRAATTEEGKAGEIWSKLKDQKSLIIIDDVWNEFELETLGISLRGENKSCKILLTTRIQQVCKEMNCQEIFELKILLEDEAWDLFKDISFPMDTELIDVAKELASKCQGLPLAIITVAKAVKGRPLNEWETAKRRLKYSSHLDNQNNFGKIYRCLSLSYDYLKGENTKSCFLLCSLFPEDEDISIDLLALMGIGMGLFCNIDSIEDQRKEIRDALQNLQRSGLLLEFDDKEDTIRMHDMVREFAHGLTSEGDTKFMVRVELTKWPVRENFEFHTAIALWYFKINSFPNKLEFTKLKTMILSGNRDGDDLLTIPDSLLEGMKALRVLWLEEVKFSPKALQILTNLRALFIFFCKLINTNISSKMNMEKLEILFVDGIDQDELFDGFGRLSNLKYLCFIEDIKFPSNLLSRLTSLEELHVLGKNNINLGELSSSLSALSLRVFPHQYQCFQEGFVFPKLQSYSISINDIPRDMLGKTLRILKIRELTSSLSPFKELFCNVEDLTLMEVSGVRYIVSNDGAGGLNKLTFLLLERCKDLEYLIEPTQNHANVITSIKSLRVLDVRQCEKLKSIFSPCAAYNLVHLQQLAIRECDELEILFGFAEDHGQIAEQHKENQLRVLSNLTNLKLEFLPKLRCISSGPTYRVNLSSLNTLKIYICGKLEFLFSSSLARTLMHLEYVSIENCESLEHLISTEVENEDACCWPKFSTLKIYRCKSLKDVFSIALAQGGLPALKKIEILDCPQLMGLFSVPKESDELTPYLQFLKSQSFTNFTSFSPEDYFEILPSLTEFQIMNINYKLHYSAVKHKGVRLGQFHLKDDKLYKFERSICNAQHVKLQGVIYDKNLVPSLNKLTSLVIEGGKGLECLIDTMDVDVQTFVLSNLKELELSSLPELKCLWKGPTHNDSLSRLKVVKISKCNGLNYVLSACLAQNLVQLQQLLIADCNQLEHIISESESDIEIGSKCGHDLRPFLPNLQDLHLNNLINLSGFSSKNSPITLPLLNKLAIESCHRLVNFRIQKKVNEHVGLKELILYNSGYDMININQQNQASNKVDYGTILKIFVIQDEQVLSKVESIRLNEMHQLRGPIQVTSLQRLSELRVWNCNGLKSLFSPMLARNLPKLTLLEIRYCTQLEEIIDTTSASSSLAEAEDHLPHITFPNLESLEIIGCISLKSLFPVSVIPSLSKIGTIKIEGASKLEQIFKYQATYMALYQKRIELPNLENFELIWLSGLRSLAPMGYHIIFPFLCNLQIKRCTKLTTSFSEDFDGNVHAITQAQSPQHLGTGKAKSCTTLKDIASFSDLPIYIEEEESEVVDM